MKINQRVALFLRSIGAGKPEKAREPAEIVESLYARQQETLGQVRRGLADVAAARTRLDIRARQTSEHMHQLQQQAEQALTAGHDDLARNALGRRAALNRSLTGLARQHEALRAQEEAIAHSLHTLQSRVDGIQIRKEGLDASRMAAETRTAAARALSGYGGDITELDQMLGRAECETAALQATAAGLDELLSSATEAEFDRLGVENEIEKDLSAMRRSLQATPEPGPGPPEEHP